MLHHYPLPQNICPGPALITIGITFSFTSIPPSSPSSKDLITLVLSRFFSSCLEQKATFPELSPQFPRHVSSDALFFWRFSWSTYVIAVCLLFFQVHLTSPELRPPTPHSLHPSRSMPSPPLCQYASLLKPFSSIPPSAPNTFSFSLGQV